MSCTDMINLDFAKAFDKVDHGVFFTQTETIRHHRKARKLAFELILSNRNHFVRIPGGVSSDHGSVLSGVPQGTVLGPLYCFLYCYQTFQVTLTTLVWYVLLMTRGCIAR